MNEIYFCLFCVRCHVGGSGKGPWYDHQQYAYPGDPFEIAPPTNEALRREWLARVHPNKALNLPPRRKTYPR